MTFNESKTLGVILVNLGTPDAPTASAIRRYLAEFLQDTRVVNIPAFIWRPILFGFILPFRPSKLAPQYELIWGEHDAPIRQYNGELAKGVAQWFSKQKIDREIVVRSAMTYGNPSLEKAIEELQEQDVEDLLILPMFPQYSASTSAAIFDKLGKILSRKKIIPNIRFIRDYHDNPDYIQALSSSLAAATKSMDQDEMLVFSFHGLPEAQVASGDPYAKQCERTALALATNLGLADDQWQLTYQSRFGPAPWIKPYTSEVLAQLPSRGIKKVIVSCPGFAADCLETLEEIDVLNRGIFMEAGGERFVYTPALNAEPAHIELVGKMILTDLCSVETAD